MSDKRIHTRSTVRTLVTVLCNSPEGKTAPEVYKGWTEDISASGMQLACNEELPIGTIYVRILLPELEEKIIECQVVRQRQRQSTSLIANAGPRYVYGVRFERVRNWSDFEREHPTLEKQSAQK